MSKEAMKLALEYLEQRKLAWNVQIALREALAKPAPQQEQEPEWYHFVTSGDDFFVPYKGQAPANATALYTAPPQREWQRLTDKEREEATGWSVEHIEAKLKEKNI